MAFHKIYNSWAWTGGHADGESDFEAIARREAQEETGIVNLRLLGNGPASLEILPVWAHVKSGKHVGSHLHLNVSYLFEADDSLPLRIAQDENSAVGWIEVDSLCQKVSEPPMIPIYERLLSRANNW
jgi:8-oxo-dGTP pyrophosphatase MutT (NUDIX family)